MARTLSPRCAPDGARAGSPCGQMTNSPAAEGIRTLHEACLGKFVHQDKKVRTLLGAHFYFACALSFAGMYSLNHSFFSPARLADKRAPEPPSCQSPLPKAVPALGIHPASGTTSLFIGKRCSMRHNASSFPDYRKIHQVSQPKAFVIRSLSEMQLHVLALSASPRQGVKRESARTRSNVSLCTHCHDGVVRPDTKHGTPWRERATDD